MRSPVAFSLKSLRAKNVGRSGCGRSRGWGRCERRCADADGRAGLAFGLQARFGCCRGEVPGVNYEIPVVFVEVGAEVLARCGGVRSTVFPSWW